jgi:hypothetical protein
MSQEEQSLECDICDQRRDLNRNYDEDEQMVVKMLYTDLYSDLINLEKLIRDGRHAPGISFNIRDESIRDKSIIVKFYYIPKRDDAILKNQIHPSGVKREIMHISLFPDDVGGIHTTIPDKPVAGSPPFLQRLYLTNEHILTCLGNGKKYYTLSNYLKTLAHYFDKEEPITRPKEEPLPPKIQYFINNCLNRRLYPHFPEPDEPTRDDKKKQLVNLLTALHGSVTELCRIDNDLNKNKRRKRGGSTKVVLYLIKIEKLRELNKKLRKNKTKNKNKIEKNNKQIDELKIKIKKEKAKAKEKLKKEKAKAKEKLKKEKAKKVHITKKIKK